MQEGCDQVGGPGFCVKCSEEACKGKQGVKQGSGTDVICFKRTQAVFEELAEKDNRGSTQTTKAATGRSPGQQSRALLLDWKQGREGQSLRRSVGRTFFGLEE